MKTSCLTLAAPLLGVWTLLTAQPKSSVFLEKEVLALEEFDRSHPPEGGSALFIGDTSIKEWSTLAEDFPRVATVNHGLADSTLADQLLTFDRLVAPLKPRVVIFAAGGDELEAGRTPEQVAAAVRDFADKLHAVVPFARFVVNAVVLTPQRSAIRERVALTNTYLAAFCAAEPTVRTFVDLNPTFITTAGEPRLEFYASGGPQLSRAGYASWAATITPIFDWRSTRFEKDILAFEAADRTDPPPLDGVLFTGASSIKFWRTLERDFPGVPVLNRGFGGSFLMDCVYYFNRVVMPYRPQAVVLSAGGNDLAFGHHSPAEIAADFRAFRTRLHQVLPATKLFYLGNAHSPLRESLHDAIEEINALISAQCADDPRCVFVDVNHAMMTPEGKVRPEIFRADRLHLNDDGYAVWTKLLQTPLSAYAQPAASGWKTLFDGKDLSAWRAYNGGADAPLGWTVQDGTLALSAPPPLAKNIISRESFGNFDLELDWKISAGGNSGIMVRAREPGRYPHDSGPGMQVLDNAGHTDGTNPLTSAGSLYGMYAPTKDSTRPSRAVESCPHPRIRRAPRVLAQ